MPFTCSTKCPIHLLLQIKLAQFTSTVQLMRNRDSLSLLSLLSSSPSLKLSQSIHALSFKLNFLSNSLFQPTLLSLYSHHGSYNDSHNLLDEMPQSDPLQWNSAISELFKSDRCENARKLFDLTPFEPNEVTWSVLISGLSQNGRPHDSLLAFREMRRQTCLKVLPNTITSVISSCIQLRNISFGQQIHAFSLKTSNFIQRDHFLATSLVNLYGKCGYMEISQKVFESMQVRRNIVAWSSLISNYLNNNEPVIAINLFKKMINSGLSPNLITVTTAITACARIADILYGKELHAYFLKIQEFNKPDKYIFTSLVNLYCKCGLMNYAYNILYTNGRHLGPYQTSLWNSILTDHATNFRFKEALNMIKIMGQSVNNDNNKVPLNEVTLAIILPICVNFSQFLHGKELHGYAIKNGLDKETIVCNSLLDLYCKNGKTNLAQNVFNKMHQKSKVSYTTMINGFGLQGKGFSAIKVFNEMLRERNSEPDHITFVALISACSHSGLVKQGLKYFKMMTYHYQIIPTEENYGSLVDLLARAGYLTEAKNVIKMMHLEPRENVWGAFLGACRNYGVVNEAEIASKRLLGKEKIDELGFDTLLSNLYAELGRLDCVVKLQRKKEELGFVRKGFSWLET